MSEALLEISFGWGVKWTTEEAQRLAALTKTEIKLGEDQTLPWSLQTYRLTLDEVLSFGKEFTVKQKLPYRRLSDEIELFVPNPTAPAPVNNKCNVIVAGTSVMEIREVKVFTDYCTDALQGELDSGWRILAICVQPNQRRPDYVLGKLGKSHV